MLQAPSQAPVPVPVSAPAQASGSPKQPQTQDPVTQRTLTQNAQMRKVCNVNTLGQQWSTVSGFVPSQKAAGGCMIFTFPAEVLLLYAAYCRSNIEIAHPYPVPLLYRLVQLNCYLLPFYQLIDLCFFKVNRLKY